MANEKEMALAKSTFDTVCRALDQKEWRYDKDEKDLSIRSGVKGEDIPIDFVIKVDADRQVVRLMSFMPFSIAEDKRLDVTIALCAINNNFANGSFDYDISDGTVFFKMTNSFTDSELAEEVIDYMVLCACTMIDKYNDKFLMLSKGILSIEQFLSSLEN